MFMTSVALTIIQPKLRDQRFSCHGCGDCCRGFSVQLRPDDLAALREQGWEDALGESPVVEFRGRAYLRQRQDGACVFLMQDGRCRIHAEHGFEAKPIACRLFPFHLTPGEKGAVMGLSFACPSVMESRGVELSTHRRELLRLASEIPDADRALQPPMLTSKLRATWQEVKAVESHFDAWLRRGEIDLSSRLDAMGFIVQQLAQAKLERVRGERFDDLLEVLFSAMPQELEHHPLSRPSFGQRRMLRQAVFARIEDPKLGAVLKAGKARTALEQFRRSRRFARGRGTAPNLGTGWPHGAMLEDIEHVGAARDDANVAAIDDLITRWLRAGILSGRAWGFGYYFWPVVAGLGAMMLNVCAVGWLARLHALGRGSDGRDPANRSITIEDVRAAVARIDRTAGRAAWLGARPERMRLAYFNADDGLRRLLAEYGLMGSE